MRFKDFEQDELVVLWNALCDFAEEGTGVEYYKNVAVRMAQEIVPENTRWRS